MFKLPLLAHSLGQSLLEVLVALAIAVLVLLALVSLATGGLKNAQFSRNQDLAEKLAQEGMEWVRAQRDQISWADFSFKQGATTWCLNDLTYSFVNLPADSPSCNYTLNGVFRRTLLLQPNDTDCGTGGFKASVIAIWNDSGGPHQSEQISCFTNWQKK